MFLVTTPNQKYWKTDEKILFLNESCKLYSEKHIWSNLDHETLPSPWDQYQQFDSHRTYIDDIGEKYLKVLASNLNNCHNEDRSIRYWRIIIGPWLRMFIDIIYDRYLSIKSAIDSKKVTGTWIPNISPELCVPMDTINFFSLAGDNNNFNLFLYGRVMMKLGKIPFKRKEDESFLNLLDLSEAKGKGLDGFREIMNQKYYHKIAGAISKNIPNRFHKIVFCSPGLSLCDNLKLVFSLGQSPFVAPFIPSCRTPIKKNLRNNIKVSEETDEFESILNDLVAEQLPISFFEGYLAMRNKSLEVYPKRTKVICTANKIQYDVGFSFWVANQVEKGAKLVLIQHGGGYGLYSTFWEKHELKICDKFFSWGWGREQLKVSPMTTPMPHMKHNKRSDPTGPILWAETAPQPFVVRTDNVAAGTFDHKFLLQQKRFVNAICSEARKLLLVRLYTVDYGGWNEKERLKDMYPSLKFARKGDSMVQALRGSRLCVHGYFGTTWLETLSINFPTVVYWDLNRVHTRASVQSYLDDLRRVKILHDTPESAAEFINKVYEDPLLWWMSSELQQVKDKFCHLFARTSKNWLKEWKEELLKIAEI